MITYARLQIAASMIDLRCRDHRRGYLRMTKCPEGWKDKTDGPVPMLWLMSTLYLPSNPLILRISALELGKKIQSVRF